jgi:hypothetical protein
MPFWIAGCNAAPRKLCGRQCRISAPHCPAAFQRSSLKLPATVCGVQQPTNGKPCPPPHLPAQ